MKQTDKEIINGLIKRFSEATKESRKYTYPRSINISGIDTVIVDPHNEVLPFWYLKDKPPATLIHIDRHADTLDCAESLESISDRLGKTNVDSVGYAKYYHNVASFISAAIFYQLVSSVYWINPIKYQILEFGRKRKEDDLKSLVTMADGKIVWDVDCYPRVPHVTTVSFDEMKEDINGKSPIILDIDLDAFECVDDKDYKIKNYKSLGLYSLLRRSIGVSKRFEILAKLSNLPKPERITIARSQTPQTYVPSSKVNYLEQKVIEELNKVYT